ncbi:sugar ABC transporter permease [Pseudonocardia zijingensis]|jgi:multiple sugar transport system permease protein|uniref:Sugar ABC transporter permease n=1 Tax=Pseudonocardia zijingensis TaxID=153376 RepID=A0ABN1N9H9_9PSEU
MTAAEPTARAGRRRGLTFPGLLLTPGVALLAVLSVLPFLALVAMSLSRVRLLGGVRLEWVGLDNWVRVLTDVDMWWSWVRTGAYLVLTLGIEMVLGLAVALALHRVLRGRGILLSLVLLPMFVAPVIVGLLGRYLTDSTFGLYAWFLQQLGWEGDVLGSPGTAFAAVVLMDVWEWTPLITLIALAGLTSVNPSLLEAAALDGAGYWAGLRHVVLPSISGILLVALLIRAMDAVRYYDIISVTTNGGPADATKTIPIRLFENAFRFFDLGYAAAIGLMMLLLTIAIARAFVRLLGTRGIS